MFDELREPGDPMAPQAPTAPTRRAPTPVQPLAQPPAVRSPLRSPVVAQPGQSPQEADSALVRQAMQAMIDLRDLTQAQVPEGIVIPLGVQLTAGIWFRHEFNPPVFSVLLINDSANTILYRVPNDARGTLASLLTTETITIGFPYPKITSIGFVTLPGTPISTMRVRATR